MGSLLLFLLATTLLATVGHCAADPAATAPSSEPGGDDWTAWLQYIRATSTAPDPQVLDENYASASGSTSLEQQQSSGVSLLSGRGYRPTSVGDRSWKRHQRAERRKVVIVVSQDGKGDFTTVHEAVAAVPDRNSRRVVIKIKAGFYHEKFDIPKGKPYITLLGDGQGKTIISFNSTASTDGPGDLPLRTYHSATVGVSAQYFIAKHLTFENTAPAPNPGDIGKQAVAFRISADRAAFYYVSFLGHQDTLYDQRGRHYFRNCYIQGSIDFIFGYGRSLYKDCHIHSIATTFGSLTAQKRNATLLDTGFSFVDCTVTGSGSVYLGRAWGDHSRVVYAYTYLADIIVPEGWQNWNLPEREKTVFYAQYKCYGPGANVAQRVPWAKILTADEAEPFLTVGFINGKAWLPST